MFLSVGFWLLDIPHQVAKGISYCVHKARYRNKTNKPFIDTYAYDLGYHMSYGLTVFQISMVFSTLVPYVPAFACIFFFFKYYVDKYNLSFVYNTEFRGVGIIRKRVVPFSVFNIVVYQLMNVAYFSIKVIEYNITFLVIGSIIIVAEVTGIAFFSIYTGRKRYTKHRNLRENQRRLEQQAEEARQARVVLDDPKTTVGLGFNLIDGKGHVSLAQLEEGSDLKRQTEVH
jgi:hypothetical protein